MTPIEPRLSTLLLLKLRSKRSTSGHSKLLIKHHFVHLFLIVTPHGLSVNRNRNLHGSVHSLVKRSNYGLYAKLLKDKSTFRTMVSRPQNSDDSVIGPQVCCTNSPSIQCNKHGRKHQFRGWAHIIAGPKTTQRWGHPNIDPTYRLQMTYFWKGVTAISTNKSYPQLTPFLPSRGLVVYE